LGRDSFGKGLSFECEKKKSGLKAGKISFLAKKYNKENGKKHFCKMDEGALTKV
jgi:hypothetical protein